MDVSSLKQTIETYESQLKQVDQALEASGDDNSELLELRDNLLEVIELTNESLLALTKAEALQSLESSPHGAGVRDEDDEYAAFQAALGDDILISESSVTAESSTAASSGPNDSVPSSELDDIIGTCVRAPYHHSWGGYQYHNAAIIGLDTNNEQVKVMYCQPTHTSMKICPYYLQGTCRYSDSDCVLSHGHPIHIDELREYESPPDKELAVGDVCLAMFSEDNLWYEATVVDTHGEDFLQVMFNDYGESTHAVERSDVILRDEQPDSSSSSDEELVEVEPLDEETPSYLWRPSPGEQLAEWESHTRGIGSKLMAAMGYRAGEGLGKVSQGRVEPVPILKLPPGKSLDKIMQLKERSGNRDMFDVMKKKKHDKSKMAATAQRPKKSAKMFEYLNKSLGHGKKVDLTAYRRNAKGGDKPQAPSVISKHELNKKSDKSINIQVIQTEEEVARVEREILSIKQRLEANLSRKDAGGVRHLTEKLSKAERYLQTLVSSHRELNRHRGQREGRKKLMVF